VHAVATHAVQALDPFDATSMIQTSGLADIVGIRLSLPAPLIGAPVRAIAATDLVGPAARSGRSR